MRDRGLTVPDERWRHRLRRCWLREWSMRYVNTTVLYSRELLGLQTTMSVDRYTLIEHSKVGVNKRNIFLIGALCKQRIIILGPAAFEV